MTTAAAYIAGATRYRVVAPVIVVALGGRDRYLPRNSLLPPEVGQQLVEHLLSRGLVAEVEQTKNGV